MFFKYRRLIKKIKDLKLNLEAGLRFNIATKDNFHTYDDEKENYSLRDRISLLDQLISTTKNSK